MRGLLALLLLMTLVGCGYHFPGRSGRLPGGVEKLQLPLFVNRTLEPLLENRLSDAVTEAFSRNRQIQLVEREEVADAQLLGTISAYRVTPLSYDSNDEISEYRASLAVEVSLRRVTDGKLLWQGELSWQEEYPADDDKGRQEDLERVAIEEISRRLGEELLFRLLDDF